MAAVRYDLVVDQGSDYFHRFLVPDELVQPVTAPEWTAAGQIRVRHSSPTALATLNVIPNGQYVDLWIPGVTSSLWSFIMARYDVELTSPDLSTTRLAEGWVIVRPEVTRGTTGTDPFTSLFAPTF